MQMLRVLLTTLTRRVSVSQKKNQLEGGKQATWQMEQSFVSLADLPRPKHFPALRQVSKDLKLTYANIFVQLGKKTTGGEIVYGVHRHDKISERISMRKFTQNNGSSAVLTMTLTTYSLYLQRANQHNTSTQTTEIPYSNSGNSLQEWTVSVNEGNLLP